LEVRGSTCVSHYILGEAWVKRKAGGVLGGKKERPESLTEKNARGFPRKHRARRKTAKRNGKKEEKVKNKSGSL